MKSGAVFLLLGCIAGRAVLAAAQGPAVPAYPPTPRGAAVDDFGATRVADPYRALESVGSSELRSWITAENAASSTFLAQLPLRRGIGADLNRLAATPVVSTVFGGGERLFYLQRTDGENQAALYVQDRPTTAPRMLVDPNVFSPDGYFAIVDEAASPDGRFLAYAVSSGGSSWRVVRIRDVRLGQDQPEELHEIRSSPLSWTHDNRGFFYVRTDSVRNVPELVAPPGRQRIYYHRVGRSQKDDQLVYENDEHPDWRLDATLSTDGQYLVITLAPWGDTHDRIYFIDLDNASHPNLRAPVVRLFDNGDALYQLVANSGPVFYFRTDKRAPRTRVVAVDINSPDENHWTTIVPETYDPLVGATRLDDRIVAHRLHDAHSVLELYGLAGGARGTIPLPGVGTVTNLSPRVDTRELYFDFSSFLQPPAAYRYDLDARNVTPFRDPPVDSSLAQLETKQLFFTSKDGTRVPMFITARRGITLDGTHPTLLSCYGSFGRSSTPSYSPLAAEWLARGGIYAVANVRGGGEDGRLWHQSGMGAHKQTAIDDLIAAGDFLINQRYTRAGSLGVIGSGAGGMLDASALVERPDLFAGAAIDGAPLDLVRAPRFGIGASWTHEFGSPQVPAELHALLAYSPLQIVHRAAYPATLITAGEDDDVVPPFNSYKFAAALQASQSGSAPILLRVEPGAGHGPATPTSKRIAIAADRLAFLAYVLHLH